MLSLNCQVYWQGVEQTATAPPFAKAVTKIVTPDHEDPEYTDVCYEITREMCDFCCLVDFEFCSRDIGICDPVTDRHLILIVHCFFAFGIVLCGFPLVVSFVKCFILYRFLERFYPDTAGLSCYEMIMRSLCIMFCIKFDATYRVEEGEEEEDLLASKGPIFKLFFYLFCCFFCPKLVLKGSDRPSAEDEEDGPAAEGTGGEGEGEGEEDGGGDGGEEAAGEEAAGEEPPAEGD